MKNWRVSKNRMKNRTMKEPDMFDKLSFVAWIPGGIGIMGLMLATEKEEAWVWRLVGASIALVMSPFMLLTVGYLVFEDFVDHFRRKTSESE